MCFMFFRVWGQALWVTVGVSLLVGACSKNAGPPPLPPVPKLQMVAEKNYGENVEYRNKPGEAIAPVVVSDDPAPVAVVAAPPSSGGKAPPTLNGDPNGLTREALNQSIQGAMGSLASCFSSLTQDPMVAVSFEADPSGRPSLVRVNGAPPDAERCIRNIVQGVRFPAFQGKGVQVDLPLSFHRVGRPAQPQNPSAEQQQAAPLFIQP
jgi:hypothetical protein